MKASAKVVFLLSVLLMVLCPLLYGQSEPVNNPGDDEFNIFLFSLAAVCVCGMIGAAIVGAVAAALILFFLFALIAVGALSTSVAIGLYNRSYAAGFKSFLIIFFMLGCAAIGSTGVLLVSNLFHLPLSNSMAALTGLTGGLCGGWLMGLATYQTIQAGIQYLAKRLRLSR